MKKEGRGNKREINNEERKMEGNKEETKVGRKK